MQTRLPASSWPGCGFKMLRGILSPNESLYDFRLTGSPIAVCVAQLRWIEGVWDRLLPEVYAPACQQSTYSLYRPSRRNPAGAALFI